MVDVGQIYCLMHNDTSLEHFVVLDVDELPASTARATIFSFEKNETHNVHARTLQRVCERVA